RAQGDGDDRLEVRDLPGVLVRALAKLPVELNRNAHEIADGIAELLGQLVRFLCPGRGSRESTDQEGDETSETDRAHRSSPFSLAADRSLESRAARVLRREGCGPREVIFSTGP